MDDTPRKQTSRSERTLRTEHGLARFEVLGRDGDQKLIRDVARRLAENSPESTRLRQALSGTVEEAPARKGGIYTAVRRSPLVGSGIDLTKTRHPGRDRDP